MVSRLQNFVNLYAWHGLLVRREDTGRAWMNAPTATADRNDGGLQIPSVRDALLLLSATTIQRWYSPKDPVAKAVGAVLAATTTFAQATHIAAGRGPDHTPRLEHTLAATGRSVLRHATVFPWDSRERDAVLALLPQAGRATLRDGRWMDGWYQRDYTQVKSALNEIRAIQRTRAGRLNLQALLHTRVVGSDLLLHSTGRPLRSSDLPGLNVGEATVHEVLELVWVSATTLRFMLRGSSYPYEAVDSFRLLCDTLVFGYPELLQRHISLTHLEEKGKSADTWTLQTTTQGIRLVRLDASNEARDLGEIVSLHHAESVARSATRRTSLKFAPHPSLSPVLPLWGTSQLHDRTTLKKLVSKTKTQLAAQDIRRRRDLALESSVEFGTALDFVGWKIIHQLPHSSSRQRLLFFRIKGQRMSGWDRLHNRRGCPHCDNAGAAGGSVYHIVWECPAAQALWARLRQVFAALGLWRTLDAATRTELLTAVFSLRLPRVPPKVWELPTLRKCMPEDADTGAGPFSLLQVVWQQLTLETLVVINAWRNGMTGPDRAWTKQQAAVVHAASCHRVLDTLLFRLTSQPDTPTYTASLIAKVHGLIDQDQDSSILPPCTAATMRVLFFAGTSPGNPGPGGAGAVIALVSGAGFVPEILWSSAVSIPDPTTTTNHATYNGILEGLQAAHAYGWRDLIVIGTCGLVLRQLREYRAPKDERLRLLYHRARRLADMVGVTVWHHQVKHHNTMAVTMASHAMDTALTSRVLHPTDRICHADLPQLAASDLQP